MSLGEKPLVDSDYWVMTPEVEIRPILVPIFSVNQSAPSGPAVIAKGWLLAVGTAYSVKVGVCPSSVKIEEAAAKPRMTAEALIAPRPVRFKHTHLPHLIPHCAIILQKPSSREKIGRL
jgi:hypothetical protein